MYRVLPLLVAAVMLVGCSDDTSKLSTVEQKYSYALGQDIGKSLKQLPVKMEVEYLFQGVRDALADEHKLTDEETKAVLQEFATKMRGAQAEKQKTEADENAKTGKAYQDKNAKKEGVTVTKSGLQIETLKEGTGPSPKATDTVTVNYEGRLVDGTVFDSSYKRKQPATFPLNRVIAGWTEGLQHMKVGGKYRLVVPPELAYGPNGTGSKIGPNSTLVFDVELLSIGDKKPAADADKAGSDKADSEKADSKE